jgi:uncharacterized protein YdhG (YjbR/CyaY superfamily)
MALLTHDDYFAGLAPEVRARLQAIQHTLETLLPEATRCISYGIPAYREQKVFFYFAAFKHHIGIYPPVRHDQALIAALAAYRGQKGNLSFPLAQALPLDLISRVALALHLEHQTSAP